MGPTPLCTRSFFTRLEFQLHETCCHFWAVFPCFFLVPNCVRQCQFQLSRSLTPKAAAGMASAVSLSYPVHAKKVGITSCRYQSRFFFVLRASGKEKAPASQVNPCLRRKACNAKTKAAESAKSSPGLLSLCDGRRLRALSLSKTRMDLNTCGHIPAIMITCLATRQGAINGGCPFMATWLQWEWLLYWVSVLWPHIPDVSIVSDTLNMDQNGIGNCLGMDM